MENEKIRSAFSKVKKDIIYLTTENFNWI